MTDEEINELKADYLILDEFHRCGAEIWGKSVLTLLRSLTDVPLLGLSATAIRYLDNQRNMADELFDGNIASEITLGQAIVRGILNPPKYVLSIYSYRKDLERYEQRVRNAKSKIVRENAIRYIEALRRNLDEADGLDDIFDKHISDRHGKYIIFKLRTLKVDREAENERDMSKDDKRRTMWGELLRRCKIDEIPQAINVIIGHMSIVGPRPTVAEHVVLYDSMEKHRLDMRPGITGLAQVNGNGSLIWEDRIAYDLEYIKDFNIFLDIIIMIKTIGVVIMGEDKFCKPKSNVSKENSKYYW